MIEKRKYMNSLEIDKEWFNNNHSPVEYNKEPVFFCKHCLSLKIRSVHSIEDSEFCDDCGSTNIETCHIEEWQKLYGEKFGHDFLETY